MLGLAGLIVVALGAAFIADPVFTGRALQLPFGGDGGVLETVAGGPVAAIPVAAPAVRSIDSAALDEALAYGAEMQSHALLVYHGGALQLEHYYPGHDAATLTPTQSMHKSVLAMLVGIAIRDGLIGSVDDEVGRYLPEWADDDRGRMTLRQMLQQSSGIGFPGFAGFMRLTLGDRLEARTLATPLLGPPGKAFDYNAINPEALGILLQRVAGIPYARYLSDRLWRHVSDDDASVVLDSATTRTPRTFCCLNATARSWLRVGLLYLTAGRAGDIQVVPAAWLTEITQSAPTNPNYGLLTWLGREYTAERRYNSKSSAYAIHSAPFAAPDVIYFDGFGGQRVYVIPSRQLVIVRTGDIRFDWDDARLPNVIIGGLQ